MNVPHPAPAGAVPGTTARAVETPALGITEIFSRQASPGDQPPGTAAPGGAAPGSAAPDAPAGPPPTPRRSRRWPAIVAAVTVLGLVGSGAYAYTAAHKTVTIDVDGELRTVATYSGDVSGLLAEEGITTGEGDVVTPAAGDALREGGLVVVRYAHDVTVEIDGERTDVTLASLDADEALARLDLLADRDSRARLVPSRLGDRLAMSLRLDATGPVALVADGATRTVPDGGTTVEELLDRQGVTVDADDRVSVVRERAVAPGAPTVRVVVQRVVTEDVPTVTAIPFETVTRQDPNRYEDLAPALVQEGADGERTRVDSVTTVDGAEESRTLVSDGVTREPVQRILAQGTKERPKPPPPPAPRPAAPRATAPQQATPAPAPAPVNLGDVWARLAQCESGGNPATNTGNGYYGLYQFSLSTWYSVGGSGLPSDASAGEQTMRAQILQQRSGWGQWPACAAKLGLL
ncbi:resuscitation-promoting factor [Antribacter gilvus]|uniref:resuscitation-promoting factor n=1 Tax=Antribacter gilvus TaxID=2304675 RepID=UPI001F0B862D|nr:resuscitation-promoting factor [Antribacter gilvus]